MAVAGWMVFALMRYSYLSVDNDGPSHILGKNIWAIRQQQPTTKKPKMTEKEETNWMECFGEKGIVEIVGGNTTLTRGAFGDISLALQTVRMEDASNDDDDQPPDMQEGSKNNENGTSNGLSHHQQKFERKRLRLVSIKTIHLAFTSTKSVSNNQTLVHLTPAVQSEILALRSLPSHHNITRLHAMFVSKQPATRAICLAFDYCPADLHLAMEWRRRTFRPLLSFEVLRTITRDILAALHHCHAHGILHGQ